MKLTISAVLGDSRDEMMTEVPIRPWGMQAMASASGTATDDTTVFVGLAPGRDYAEPEMMIVALALGATDDRRTGAGHDAYSPFEKHLAPGCFIPPDTTADRAGDLLAATSALTYLQAIKNVNAPEAVRLTDRIRGLVAELITSRTKTADGPGWRARRRRIGRATA